MISSPFSGLSTWKVEKLQSSGEWVENLGITYRNYSRGTLVSSPVLGLFWRGRSCDSWELTIFTVVSWHKRKCSLQMKLRWQTVPQHSLLTSRSPIITLRLPVCGSPLYSVNSCKQGYMSVHRYTFEVKQGSCYLKKWWDRYVGS